jgi:hypothetical protein
VNQPLPGGSNATRLAIFPALLYLVLVAIACGTDPATGPSNPDPPPPSNASPVVTSILVKGILAREPAQYATLGETVNVTATVTDAETPVNQLTYEWSSSVGGTFGSNAPTTTWTAPATLPGTTPVNATLTLTVVERVDATRNNRVTATSVVDLHNSPKEVGDLAILFLEDFSKQLPVENVMRNFTATCPEAAEERAQVEANNATNEVMAYSIDHRHTTTVPFGGTCPFIGRNPRGDACAQVAVSWTSKKKSTGAVGTNSGVDQVTALLEDGRWKLCASDYNLLTATGSRSMADILMRQYAR